MTARGQLILISAPSGAGKTSLVQAALERDPGLVVSISHTTRPQRRGEQDGVNYHFCSTDDFNAMVQSDEFLEHAVVFGNQYGTAKSQVNTLQAQGLDVILEIDWQGADQIRQLVPDVVSIFILPPSLDTLSQRLASRGQDSEESMSRRLAEAKLDIQQAVRYQYLIVNDDFGNALTDLLTILQATRLSTYHAAGQQSCRCRTDQLKVPGPKATGHPRTGWSLSLRLHDHIFHQ